MSTTPDQSKQPVLSAEEIVKPYIGEYSYDGSDPLEYIDPEDAVKCIKEYAQPLHDRIKELESDNRDLKNIIDQNADKIGMLRKELKVIRDAESPLIQLSIDLKKQLKAKDEILEKAVSAIEGLNIWLSTKVAVKYTNIHPAKEIINKFLDEHNKQKH